MSGSVVWLFFLSGSWSDATFPSRTWGLLFRSLETFRSYKPARRVTVTHDYKFNGNIGTLRHFSARDQLEGTGGAYLVKAGCVWRSTYQDTKMLIPSRSSIGFLGPSVRSCKCVVGLACSSCRRSPLQQENQSSPISHVAASAVQR